jgi:hypothetical protein
MAERLFLFVQLELPWELGPPDGRYLLRGGPEREPRHVVVLNTLGASRRARSVLRGRRRARPRPAPPQPDPAPVPVTRATVIDPVALASETQAKAWLKQLDVEREIAAAAAVLGEVVFAHRIATADPYLLEPSPARALVIRAGWGEGEQVADGHWRHALELPVNEPHTRRVAALRPLERLAGLLGRSEAALLSEELTLRARRDLDQRRLLHATVELRGAYAAALTELHAEARPDLAGRLEELRRLTPSIAPPEQPEEQTVRHALERLEAALRARTAGSF